tara:strand:+ start:1638 stop:2417 length:780 start_codon:yes stop_codon:yes gene_type:complete
MGLLLKVGINADLVKTALLAFSSISIFIFFLNYLPKLKRILPNYSLQMGGLIGNTSFLGIPIAIALLPTNTINFTIGFDLGTTLFAWVFGPYFLQNNNTNYSFINIRTLLKSILSSPASKGIIGVLITYMIGIEKFMGEILWIPARIVIFLAIIVVGTRLGIILNNKKHLLNSIPNIWYSIILKLFIFPIFVFIVCTSFQLNKVETMAIVLQAATPSAISTILMAEAYKKNQETAAKVLFITTIMSIITIPLITVIIKS